MRDRYGVSTKFIELAGEVNVRMPEYVVGKVQEALNDCGRAVKGAKVLVLGLAYKKDIDDPRESPAFEVIHELLKLGADVSYHDPYVPVAPKMRSWPNLPAMTSRPLSPEVLSSADVAHPRGVGGDFIKRFNWLVALCPLCHAQAEAPCARGRLGITPLGDRRFTAEVTRGADKWAIRA